MSTIPKFKVGDVLESNEYDSTRIIRVEIVDTSDDTYMVRRVSGFGPFDGSINWYGFIYIHFDFHLKGSPTRKVRKPFFRKVSAT